MISIRDAKQWLRNYARRRRMAVTKSELSHRSSRAVSKLVKTSAYRKAKTVALYLSFGSELVTDSLVKKAWKDRKTVLIPMTSRGLHNPFFCEYRPVDRLRKTKFGPLELLSVKKDFPWSRIHLVVVPGLAFDESGGRLGYGGGTYDRILAKTPRAKHIGLFFSAQKMAYLPSENHDRNLDDVFTD